jgi:2-C-methyl-D-erythritol 4-phosphate cytidylyltransferase/2-C-methyl-D-erythritol 2,4-cyclodiphosphate synthase
MPVVDTVKAVSGNAVNGTVDRSGLAAAQTPQVFHLADILSLHQAHDADTQITDDIQLIEASGRPVAAVEGDRRLMKLTTAEDFAILETLIRTAEGSNQMIP